MRKAMSALWSGRTTFVIAHRLSMVRDADFILIMDARQIVEQGTRTFAAEGGRTRLCMGRSSGLLYGGLGGGSSTDGRARPLSVAYRRLPLVIGLSTFLMENVPIVRNRTPVVTFRCGKSLPSAAATCSSPNRSAQHPRMTEETPFVLRSCAPIFWNNDSVIQSLGDHFNDSGRLPYLPTTPQTAGLGRTAHHPPS